MSIPATKTARQARIVALVTGGAIHSQAELAARLAARLAAIAARTSWSVARNGIFVLLRASPRSRPCTS